MRSLKLYNHHWVILLTAKREGSVEDCGKISLGLDLCKLQIQCIYIAHIKKTENLPKVLHKNKTKQEIKRKIKPLTLKLSHKIKQRE